jgi:hypothetical protein
MRQSLTSCLVQRPAPSLSHEIPIKMGISRERVAVGRVRVYGRVCPNLVWSDLAEMFLFHPILPARALF